MRDDLLSPPDSAAYRAATTPHNAAVVQRPATVAHARSADDVVDAVRWAAQHDLRVAVQASGHGAGAQIGADHLLVDTSGLNSVDVDVAGRVARVGAGATWSAVNAVAERDGLLGLAGSSPTVGVAGYTFGGGGIPDPPAWHGEFGTAGGRLRGRKRADEAGDRGRRRRRRP